MQTQLNNLSRISFCLVLLTNLFGLVPNFAFGENEPKIPVAGPAQTGRCMHELNLLGITRIVPSGREAAGELKWLEERTLAASAAAQRIGMTVPPQIMEIVPASELMILATLGRHGLYHWYDGMKLLRPYGSAGVMEFVTPGSTAQCGLCRSFFSATTQPIQQGSIIDHVLGHNDYSANSAIAQAVNVDVIRESLELAEYIQSLYHDFDHDQVSQFVQWLYSFSYLQDLSRNTFDSPESLDPKKRPGVVGLPERVNHASRHLDGSGAYQNAVHPKIPTPSVLQFMASNLPVDAPAWQRETLRRFERVSRILIFYTADKYSNEGWATDRMRVLAGHTGTYATDEHTFEYMNLLQGVAGWASLSNPYWLGRETIRTEFKKFEKYFEGQRRASFEAEAAAQGLTGNLKIKRWAEERDRGFTEHFHRTFMQPLTDYEIMQATLSDQWVHDQGLFLYRTAKRAEYDPNLPPPPTDEPIEQKIITSTDGRKVVREIAKKTVDRRFSIPRIFVQDSDAFGRGVLSLNHEMVRDDQWRVYGKPLELWGTAQTLYLMARVMGKSVSLETVHITSERIFKSVREPMTNGQFRPFWPVPFEVLRSTRIRIEVDRRGRVAVYKLPDSVVDHRVRDINVDDDYYRAIGWKIPKFSADGFDFENISPWDIQKEVPDEVIAKKLQEAVDEYRTDQEISINSDLRDAEKERLLHALTTSIVDGGLAGQFRVLSHAPTGAGSINEYKDMLDRRLYASLMRALSGQLRSRQTATGLKFRVMPIIPHITFDDEITEKIQDAADPDQVDPAYFLDPLRRMVQAKTPQDHFAAEKEVETLLLKRKRHLEAWKRFQAGDQKIEGVIQHRLEAISGTEALGSDPRPRKKGDKVWGPSKPRGGGGGKRGNDDGPGEPGDDPGGDKPGDGSSDPSEIEVPLDVLAEFIGAQIELPFLKPKGGDLDAKDTIRDGGVRKPTGDPLWNRMWGDILAKGRLMAKKNGKDVSKMTHAQLVRIGMKLTTPPDYIVADRIVDPVPDTNAVVAFVVDQSGSMWGRPIEQAKKFIFNVKMAIKSKYQNTKFFFVSIDTKGIVYYDENEFWKSWQGGGTDYSEGFSTAHEELNKFSPAGWDRYLVGIGDSGTSNEQLALEKYEAILREIEYGAYVHVEDGWGGFEWPFAASAKGLLETYKNAGFATLSGDAGSPMKALLDLFGKDRHKK